MEIKTYVMKSTGYKEYAELFKALDEMVVKDIGVKVKIHDFQDTYYDHWQGEKDNGIYVWWPVIARVITFDRLEDKVS